MRPLRAALLLAAVLCCVGCQPIAAARPLPRYTYQIDVLFGITDGALTVPLRVSSDDELDDFVRSVQRNGYIVGTSSAYYDGAAIKHSHRVEDRTRGCTIIAGAKSIRSIVLVEDRGEARR